MRDEPTKLGGPAAGATNAASLPTVVDRDIFQAELDSLRVREKAHTREGDAIAAARRRLPMVEVDPTITLIGPDGPVSLLEAFEGRRQLIAYYFMWHTGHPAAEQCEGSVTLVLTQEGSEPDRDHPYVRIPSGFLVSPSAACRLSELRVHAFEPRFGSRSQDMG